MGTLRDLFRRSRRTDAVDELRERTAAFRSLLTSNNRVLELIGDAGEKLGGEYLFDSSYLRRLDDELAASVDAVVQSLRRVTPRRHDDLVRAYEKIRAEVAARLESRTAARSGPFCISMDGIGTEHVAWVGEKMARLGEIGNRLGFPVPQGFTITAAAFDYLARSTGVAELMDVSLESDPELGGLSARLSHAIGEAKLPRDLLRTIKRAAGRFPRGARFAVRSSALGEDGGLSYAGVHRSELNVPRSEVPDSFLQVAASLFGERALRYRRDHDEPLAGASMAVGCLAMIPAAAAGVLFTLDPSNPERDEILVNGSWGLGTTVVEGAGAADSFSVSRRPPHQVLRRKVADKETMRAPAEDGGSRLEEIPPARRKIPCVSDSNLSELARIALAIERHMRCPQDMEWAIDDQGRVWVLQARPLQLGPAPPERSLHLERIISASEVLMQDRGEIACRGIGAGRVVAVKAGMRPDDLPLGGVLLARFPSPALSVFVPRAAAVVTDGGTATGHLATLAREHRIPTLVNTGVATSVLPEGMEVTVDTEERVVYAGVIDELLRYGLLQGDAYGDKREFRVLRSMLSCIAPLNLVDPSAPDFSPEGCRTYHDIIRYAHEKALMELSDVGDLDLRRTSQHACKLDLDIPLDLVLVDIGHGMEPSSRGVITLPQLRCRPLKVLLDALTRPGVWATKPADMDLAGFMASATRSAALGIPGAAQVERNMAIVSASYMNLSLRLGYHFNVIDALVGEGEEDSYIHFRFVGGVTEMARRLRRATLICDILSHHDFSVDRSGDLVVARLDNASQSLAEERLEMIGRLVGFTRQLDILLRDTETAQHLVAEFLKGSSDAAPKGIGREDTMADKTQVLVLDDEPTVGERLKDFLEKKEMEVEAFTASQAAIERLAQKRFDVVVTDLKMEGPTGLDVLKHVRDQKLPTQVIIITAYGNIEDARAAEYVGAFDFINKPFRMSDMHHLVKRAARRARRSG